MKTIFCALILSLMSSAFARDTLTRDSGAPVGDNQNSQTAGEAGPVTLQDAHLQEKLARFDRERIPERVVHARGAGAFGEFISSGNGTDLTVAQLFSKKGIKTPVFVRFSAVIHGNHSPETLRDPRGFATKFFTTDGNWDLVGNNLPVFFIRDAMKFPDMVHSLKPDPVNNIQDAARIFDFMVHVPESTHMLTLLFSDQGTPASFRQMDGNGVHAFKLINKKGEVRYVKFHWISKQGQKNLNQKEANAIQGEEFNHMTKDLYTEINKGNFPSWDLEVQVLEQADLEKLDFNPLDATKEWIRIPNLKRVKMGTMTLNKVPENFFQNTEQAAFSPNVLVPGIEASEDRLLQGRLFSYSDTQRYRLGVNYQMLPINRPRTEVRNYSQDGFMNFGNSKGSVNYQPNNFNGSTDRTSGAIGEDQKYKLSQLPLSGTTQQAMIKKTLNFRQAGETYRSFSAAEKNNLIDNLTSALGPIKNEKVKYQISAHFYCADVEYGTRITESLKLKLASVKEICDKVKDE